MNIADLKDGETKHFVLVFLCEGNNVWLAYKPPGKKIGGGCWNGYGGLYEPEKDASLKRTVCREVYEEALIRIGIANPTKVGVIDFHVAIIRNGILGLAVNRAHIYQICVWDGVPQETSSMMKPTKFSIETACGLQNIMPADKYWWPEILIKKKKILGYVSLSPDMKEVCGVPLLQEEERFDPDLEPVR